ncbi:MAG: glycosyltransferase [Planctomycetota bacterium]|nr:glycosyltransferase [Planctomycetota bacterium]
MTTIVIEGWRFLPHSYSLWAMYLALELSERAGVTVYFRDAPMADAKWRPTRGVLLEEQEAIVAAIPGPPDDLRADVAARIVFPYDFGPSNAAKTFVFGTAEYGVVPNSFVAGQEPIAAAAKRTGYTVVTCSKWSKDGFLRSGVKASQMAHVICAIDPAVFTPPTDEQRREARAALGLTDEFVLLHSSSLGWNKNVEMMLDAMLALEAEMPRLRLVLKGMDALYGSGDVIERVRAQAPPEVKDRLMARVGYIGASMGPRAIAGLYHAADAYVCPYLAEGFNMPALEAAACGVPVLATAGGSADDFMHPDFCLKIASKVQVHQQSGGKYLQPNFENYVAQIRRVVRDDAYRARARVAGPAFARNGWTWSHAAEQLLAAAGISVGRHEAGGRHERAGGDH